MEVLRRRVEAFYVAKEGKVEAEKRVREKSPRMRRFSSHTKKRNGISTGRIREKETEPIMSVERIVKILAWLVYNKRFDASTAFHMIPNTTGVALSDLQALLRELNTLIPTPIPWGSTGNP
jgi:hypothetical protein